MSRAAETITVLEKKINLCRRPRSRNWQAHIKLKNGKWERITTKTDDKAEATETALKLYYGAEERAKNNLPQSTRKFRNVAKYAVNRMQTELDGGGGKQIFKDYIRVINNYLIPFFGNYDISCINIKLLTEYDAWRNNKMWSEIQARQQKTSLQQATTQPNSPFKAKQSTINTHNSALNRVFDEGLLRGWITESIRPRLLNKGEKSESRGAFTSEEYEKLHRALVKWSNTGHRRETRELRELLLNYVGFLANTGIRAGTEAYNLKWKNIQLVHGDRSEPYISVNVDGKRGKRELIARDLTVGYLKSLAELNPAVASSDLGSVIESKLDEYVFVDRSGNQVTTEALSGSFNQLLSKAGLKEGADGKARTLYSLRHTYATKALAEGRDIHKLAVQMGTSVEMLEKFYSKVSARLNADEHSGRNKFTDPDRVKLFK